LKAGSALRDIAPTLLGQKQAADMTGMDLRIVAK